MCESPPCITVFAGPNGSGKSTLTRKIKTANPDDLPSLYINADEIQQDYQLTSLQAAQEAARLRNEALKQGGSFAFETVMSTDEKIEFLIRAKAAGYKLQFVYITTRDAAVNVSRIENRVVKGEHDVPEEKVRSRYHKSMNLLPKAMQIVDTGLVYDNSGEEPILIAKKTLDGVLHLYPQTGQGGWTNQELKVLLDSSGYIETIAYISGTKMKIISIRAVASTKK